MRKLLLVAVVAMTAAPALAQAQGSDSTMCRLFPLACPGPVPPKPAPLLGTPEEQAAPPVEAAAPRGHHRAKKHVAARRSAKAKPAAPDAAPQADQ